MYTDLLCTDVIPNTRTFRLQTVQSYRTFRSTFFPLKSEADCYSKVEGFRLGQTVNDLKFGVLYADHSGRAV